MKATRADLEARLEQAVEEIIELKSQRDRALKLLANTPPSMQAAREEIETGRLEAKRAMVLSLELEELKSLNAELVASHNKMVRVVQESVQLEHFWKRTAEQALRLWDRAQDELEEHEQCVRDR